MKKFIACALLVLMCCAPLCACSLDFSAEIDETMDGLYTTLYDALELFFKKTGVEDDSDKDEGVTDGEKPNGGDNQGGENSGSGESGDNQGSQGTPDNGENGGNNTSGDNNSGDNIGNDQGGEGNSPSKPDITYEIGTQIGQKLPSYFVETFDENGLSGECIDPSALGKVTVINFWGTWCPPCVGELPEFSEVATEYKDSVTIVAIHSVQNFKAGAVSHIKNNFSDSDIIFAADEDLGEGNIYFDECYETFGGNGYYPYTIIIDENGVITYAKEGALSKAALISKIEAALAG